MPGRQSEPEAPTQAALWAAQEAPRIAIEAGCTDAELHQLIAERNQAEDAYLARWGSLAPQPRTSAETAAAVRREAWGPQSPVPYSLTPEGEAALDATRDIGPYPGSGDPERLAQWCGYPSAAAMEAACEANGRVLTATSDAEARWEAECAALAVEAEDPEAEL